MSATPAAAIGGATPFAWAQMGLGLLGGAAKPAGPSSADALFGSSMFNADSSGWMVNFGDGATQTQTSGDKFGPSMTVPQSYSKTPAPDYGGIASLIPQSGGGMGGGLHPAVPGVGVQPGVQQQPGTIAGIPVLWIVIGLGVVVLWKKK